MKDINPEEYYSASHIINNNLFPWISAPNTFLELLNTDKGKELLKPVIRDAGKKKRYFIKGSTILEIHKLAEEGNLKF